MPTLSCRRGITPTLVKALCLCSRLWGLGVRQSSTFQLLHHVGFNSPYFCSADPRPCVFDAGSKSCPSRNTLISLSFFVMRLILLGISTRADRRLHNSVQSTPFLSNGDNEIDDMGVGRKHETRGLPSSSEIHCRICRPIHGKRLLPWPRFWFQPDTRALQQRG